MRNISQIILNIDVMKELKNLEAIRELLASHPIYTYDYSDGLLINKEDTNIQVYSIDLEDEPLLIISQDISSHMLQRKFSSKISEKTLFLTWT